MVNNVGRVMMSLGACPSDGGFRLRAKAGADVGVYVRIHMPSNPSQPGTLVFRPHSFFAIPPYHSLCFGTPAVYFFWFLLVFVLK